MGTVGFDSEYRRHSFSPTHWSATAATVFDGAVAFIGVAGLVIAIFGVAPILIRWAMARRDRGSDA